MLEADIAAHKFLYYLSENDKQRLLNALIALNHTHKTNCNASFCSYRNVKRIFKAVKTERMQCLKFNNGHDELLITQFKDRSFLKNSYRIEILFNANEYDYQLIAFLLHELAEDCFVESYA